MWDMCQGQWRPRYIAVSPCILVQNKEYIVRRKKYLVRVFANTTYSSYNSFTYTTHNRKTQRRLAWASYASYRTALWPIYLRPIIDRMVGKTSLWSQQQHYVFVVTPLGPVLTFIYFIGPLFRDRDQEKDKLGDINRLYNIHEQPERTTAVRV